jgi:hypothetical protein
MDFDPDTPGVAFWCVSLAFEVAAVLVELFSDSRPTGLLPDVTGVRPQNDAIAIGCAV